MNHSIPSRQVGATLIIALVFLVVLTVAGITAMQFSTLEERMASNSQFRNETFQMAQNEIRSELLAFNSSLAGRAPLLNALNQGANNSSNCEPDSPGTTYPRNLCPSSLLKSLGLPTSARQAVNTQTPIPAPGFTVVRYARPGVCKNVSLERFECIDYELQTRSQLNNGSYSDQSQGLVFMNIRG